MSTKQYVRARLQVWDVHPFFGNGADKPQTGESVTMHPVYSADPASPNYSFSQATPSGSFQLFISNPEAFGFFKLREEFDVTFTPTGTL